MFSEFSAPVRAGLQEILEKFGKPPDATIVDTSIWDLANWWQRAGEPDDWHVPQFLINYWRNVTVPSFLDFVQDVVPHSHVALRSPPPAFNTPWRDWTRNIHEAVNRMATILSSSRNEA